MLKTVQIKVLFVFHIDEKTRGSMKINVTHKENVRTVLVTQGVNH